MINEEMDHTDAQLLRMKAEEHLKVKHNKKDISLQETDIKRLLHELQVHHIELEMQNEELRQANETSEAALKKYTMLYDFAPMGYFMLDFEANICELNFTGAEILGDRRFSLVNSNFKLFVSDESKGVFNDFFKKVRNSNYKQSCKVMLGFRNNPLRFVYIEGIVTGDDQKCLLSVIDISSFSRAE